MTAYVEKPVTVDAILYDNTLTAVQAKAFLAGSDIDRADLAIDPQTKAIIATVGLPDEKVRIPLGSWLLKYPNGHVVAMPPAQFLAQWQLAP